LPKSKSVLLVAAITLSVVVLLLVLDRQRRVSDTLEATGEAQMRDVPLPLLVHDMVVHSEEAVELEPPGRVLAAAGLDGIDGLKDEAALVQLLPAWMHEEGVAFYFEQAEVVGEPVTRCRGRYKWDDGASMEYELTDIGPTAKPELIKSLGFNIDQGNTEGETGYTAAYEMEQGTLMNHEYDEAAGEGSLQILVKDRYLLEVQLEGFEAEAFEDVIENHLPLDELLQL
jgi:hypothetical protein